MFKKSRIKIIAFVITSLIMFLFGTLLIIYTSSYLDITDKNRQMLFEYTHDYSLEKPMKKQPDDKRKFSDDVPRLKEDFTYYHIDYYSSAIGSEGNIIAVNTSRPDIYSKNEVINITNTILKQGKTSGNQGSLVYMISFKENYTLIAFMDNSVLYESMHTLIRYTILYGLLAIIIIFVLSMILSKKIVYPLEENYINQKQFISDAGHELKTPVSIISANAELLSREIGENQWLLNIRYENERMSLLIKQLLELSRNENSELQTEEINLSRLVMGESLPFESIAFEKHHSLIFDIQEDIFIIGNSVQLKQLTAILLDNALSHSMPEKDITLKLTEKHRQAIIKVINYGKEIPKEQRKHIFERFYRIDQARNSSENHYGLGLAIAKKIVTAHKGKIEVHCYNDQVEFSVTLPI